MILVGYSGQAAATTASAADAPQEASAAQVAGDSAGSAAGADTEAPAAESADLKAMLVWLNLHE